MRCLCRLRARAVRAAGFVPCLAACWVAGGDRLTRRLLGRRGIALGRAGGGGAHTRPAGRRNRPARSHIPLLSLLPQRPARLGRRQQGGGRPASVALHFLREAGAVRVCVCGARAARERCVWDEAKRSALPSCLSLSQPRLGPRPRAPLSTKQPRHTRQHGQQQQHNKIYYDYLPPLPRHAPPRVLSRHHHHTDASAGSTAGVTGAAATPGTTTASPASTRWET